MTFKANPRYALSQWNDINEGSSQIFLGPSLSIVQHYNSLGLNLAKFNYRRGKNSAGKNTVILPIFGFAGKNYCPVQMEWRNIEMRQIFLKAFWQQLKYLGS